MYLGEKISLLSYTSEKQYSNMQRRGYASLKHAKRAAVDYGVNSYVGKVSVVLFKVANTKKHEKSLEARENRNLIKEVIA